MAQERGGTREGDARGEGEKFRVQMNFQQKKRKVSGIDEKVEFPRKIFGYK